MIRMLKHGFFLPMVFGLSLVLFSNAIRAQQNKVDSLEKLLQNEKRDTTRLRYCLEIGDACNVSENLKYADLVIKLTDKLIATSADQNVKKKLMKQKALAYGWAAYYYETYGDSVKILECHAKRLAIYKEIHDTANVINMFIAFSDEFASRGNFPLALEYLENALDTSKRMNYKLGIASVLFHLGSLYANQGDRKQALVNYEKSISIYAEIKDTVKLAYAYIQTGNLYGKKHQMSKALDCFNKGLELYESQNDEDNILWVYNCMGLVYNVNQDWANSLLYYQKSLAIAEKESNTYWVAVLLNNIGNLYLKQNDFEKALDYDFRALKINRALHDDSRKAWSYDCLARTYFAQKNFKKAKMYNDSTMAIWKERSLDESLIGGHHLAASIDSANGDGMGAYEHYKEYILLRDKFDSRDVQKAATKEKYQDEYDKRKAAEKEEQDKKDAKVAAEKHKQKLIIWSVVAGLLIVLVFSGFIFRSLQITRKQKKTIEIQKEEVELSKIVIEEKNKDITDSIQYAKRIQQSLMPTEKYIERSMKRLKKE